MKVIDLTHTISEDMLVYPGIEKPKLTTANTYVKDGFKETLLQMYSHVQTHIDPPAHIFANRKTLDPFSQNNSSAKLLSLIVGI
jgi:kynurenine formamidase